MKLNFWPFARRDPPTAFHNNLAVHIRFAEDACLDRRSRKRLRKVRARRRRAGR